MRFDILPRRLKKVMFYGREEDVDDLMALWKKPTASLVTCRGRRRIGKSTLIEEFARRSKARFVEIAGTAPRKGMTDVDQLKAFGRQQATQRKRGCQIDLLLQSEKNVVVVEIKRKNEIGPGVEAEIAAKVKALAMPRVTGHGTPLLKHRAASPGAWRVLGDLLRVFKQD